MSNALQARKAPVVRKRPAETDAGRQPARIKAQNQPMNVLVVADHREGELLPSTASALAAARLCEGKVHVLIAGSRVADVAAQVARLDGVDSVRLANSPAYQTQSPETVSGLLKTLAPKYTHIIATTSSMGAGALRRLAARFELAPVTNVVAVDGPHRFERRNGSGTPIKTVAPGKRLVLMTVDPEAFEPVEAGKRPAKIVPANASDLRTITGLLAKAYRGPGLRGLEEANIVVGGGRGLLSTKNFGLLDTLAESLGGAVAATPAAVSEGLAPAEIQVGREGVSIAPDYYVAVGVSGSYQHLGGIQGARRIIAINADPEAPIMRLADYALVGDPLKIVPALTRALNKRLHKA